MIGWSQDLTVLDAGHPAVSGIGGTVDDSSLDSLSSSSHGYALAQLTGALVVPEPASAGLLTLGLGLLAGARRRR